MNIRRTLCSFRVPAAALGIFVLYLLTGSQAKDVVNSYKVGTDYREMLIFLAALPAVSIFARDWNSRFYRMITTRTSLFRYSISLLICVWLTAVCTALIGQWIYILYLRWQLPLITEITYTQPWEFDYLGDILLYNTSYLYLLAQTVCTAVVCGLFAVLGLFVSVAIPDKLTAYFSPLILYYAVTFSMDMLSAPHYLRPDYQIIGYLMSDPLKDTLLLSINLFIPLIAIPLYAASMERRCGNA